MSYISKIIKGKNSYDIRDERLFDLLNKEVIVNNEVFYDTFEEALAAAQGAVELKLLKEVILDAPINVPVGAEVVLELNGHSIKPAQDMNYAGGMITIVHGASLTINGEGTIGGYAPNLMAPLQLTNKNFMDDTKSANLTINGGHYVGNSYCICGNGNRGRGNSHIIINGGDFEVSARTGVVIFNPQENSSVEINGGRLVGANTAIEMRSGNLVVNGGHIESLNVPASVSPNGNGTTAVGSAIAICQHTTKNPINANINGGIMRGYHAFFQANPQKNDEAAVALVNISINEGSFIANNGSNIPVYSENKTGFVKGGVFSHPIDEAYKA